MPTNPFHFENRQLTARLWRFKCELAAWKVLMAGRRFSHLLSKFNTDQPRVPAGQPGGGQWTSGDGDGGIPRTATLTDPTGEATWARVVSTYGGDGALTGQLVVNRDGSTIRSEFNTGDARLAWDERHTVVTTDGARISFENSGNTQTISDAETGAVLGRTTWTDSGPEPDAAVQPALYGPAAEKAIEAAAALFVWMSGQNSADSTAVLSFRAGEFKPGDSPTADAIHVGQLSKDEVDAACPRHAEVQERTDQAADTVRREGNYWTPSQYGTAVHKNISDRIKALGDPNFVAEASFIKNRAETYGARGSIRVDVLENVDGGTVCVYDIKTGHG